MAITPEQFNKLPKYARDEIERLRTEVRARQTLIDSIGAQQKPTKVRVERYGGTREKFIDYIDPANGVEFILPSDDAKHENVILARVIAHPVVGDRLEIMGIGYPNALHVTSQASNVMHISTARY